MPGGFQIEVPITIKGGREGERVGKQIGEKIATQIKSSLRTIGFGKTTGGAGVGEAAGMIGVSKGLKGIATKLGAIGLAIGAAVGVLAKSSPYLKGILDIFGRAFMLFFRPFGDFLATLLRPLAILMMKMAVAFMKWTRPINGKVREAMKDVPQINKVGNILADVPIQLANWLLQVGAGIGAVIYEIGKGFFNLGVKIGQWLYDEVIKPAGDWISGKLFGIWDWTEDFAGWVWDQVTSIWDWTYDFGAWLWEKITSIISSIFPGRSTEPETGEESRGGGIISGIIKRTLPSLLPILGGGQTGIPLVQQDGLYKLHRGEQVIARNQANRRTVTFKPIFQFSGNIIQDIDIDSLIRRASRVTEMELKQRGIL